MSYCPRCGGKVRGGMSFCPNCGASLKVEQVVAPAVAPAEVPPAPPVPPAPTAPAGAEKAEKREKEEKGERREWMEKEERYEQREFAFMGPLVGGFVLLLAGLAFYFILTTSLRLEVIGAVVFVTIGIIIILGAVYAAMLARRRHPTT